VQKQIDARAEREGRSVEDMKTALLSEKQPMLDFSTPEQIGALSVFLSSQSAKTITGTTVSIDGGWTAQ
jgi:3-hydroxybutyrate dehydrogenase